MSNPIRYRDLVVPDSAITDLIAQLEKLNQTYDATLKNITQEASKMQASMTGVTGATDAGREVIQQSSGETDKLAQAYKKLTYAQSENGKELARLKLELQRVNAINKANAKLLKAAPGSYDNLSARYTKLKIRLNSMNTESARSSEYFTKLQNRANQLRQEMIKLQEATGNHTLSVGNYGKALNGVNLGVQQILRELPNAAISANTFFLAISNNIPILVDQIQLLRMQNAQAVKEGGKAIPVWKALGKSLVSWQTAMTIGITLLTLYGGDIVKWVQKVFLGKDAIDQAAKSQEYYTQALTEARKAEVDAITESTVLAHITVDVARSMDERLAAAELLKQKYPDYLSQYSEEEIAAGKAKTAIDNLTNSLLNQARARAYMEQIQENEKRIIELQAQIAEEQQKVDEQQAKSAVSGALSQTFFQRGLGALGIGQKGVQTLQNLRTKASENAIQEMNAEIQALEKTNKALVKNIDATALLASETQKTTKAVTSSQKKQTQATDNSLQAIMDKYDKLAKELYDAQKKEIEDSYTLSKLQIDNLQATEEEKTRLKIQAEIDRQRALLNLAEEGYVVFTDTELAIMREQLKKWELALANLGVGATDEPQDLFDVLGIQVTDKQRKAWTSAINESINALEEAFDKEKEIADRRRALADSQIEDAQRVLDAEIEARNNGYAHNVDMARKELAEAKRNQDKAIQLQQQAEKKQESLNAISQATDLVTASAKIWAQLGFPAALPALGLMWSTFAYSKIKARQLTNTESYGDGTVELLRGGSHQSGNDIDLGTKPDGTRRRAEGGEYFAVINKRGSRRFASYIPKVINSLNDGTFADKYINAYKKGEDMMIVGAPSRTDLSDIENNVRAIRSQGEQSVMVADGVTIIRYKNVTRRIRR